MPATKRRVKAAATRTERRRTRNVARSRLWLIGAAVVSAAILGAWFPASALYHQRSSLASASTQLHQLGQQDAALAQERKNLTNQAEIDRIAREQYQLVTPGQQAFEVLPPSGANSTGSLGGGDPDANGPVGPSTSTATTQPNPAAQSDTHSEGTLARMLHALEFWR
ncbi:MAG TPA: septum formation initiator family protein [Acidimicrobiales bacterium]|jgi:cell division protein FtsB